ncbi:uncharacterized protein LOC105217750 [Zeugodacus cucurbitae]|uniref:Uncharacterized protein n=1 Tax=Zeugodacus cucurbitae TaxID=28588 RepID=A0A0A1X1F8_ZEUCU|nr:uncharacterized protein LOC105217750 [Zeugodacus cucurbitae]XP_011191213.1 uncharacterized protein LOC105217750 [Zeugodacus cucurbitae]XP_054092147.1 uncharacterized protein LOC105217750 [Zeugodacus cucurbitae]
MRLQTCALILCTVIVSISCNKNHIEIEELNNFSKSSEDELLNRQANNNDEIAFNKSEIHNLNHNNKLLDSVVIINNSSDFESLFATSESNNIKSSDPKELAPASSYRKLPRHQRAIAAVAEKKGLLKNGGGERILRRGKRYLQFAKGSRVSWRTAGKNNILNINTLWAYGYGFRVNFPFPGPDESRRPFFKRNVLHSLEDVLNGHGLDGRACVLKSYCTAALDVDSSISGGMLFKMLKLIFTLHEHDKRHFSYLRLENCKQILHSHCPLSFDSISPYTDDV